MSRPKNVGWISCVVVGLAIGLSPMGGAGLGEYWGFGERGLWAQDPAPAEKDEGPGTNVDGYKPYVELIKAQYVPAVAGSDRGSIRLNFNLSTDVPKGAAVSFMLEFQGLDFEETEYTLKSENRKNLSTDWKPEKRLATGEYFLRTRLYLKKQPTTVQRTLRQNSKAFPEKFDPWPYLYMKDDKPEWKITVGGEAEARAEQAEICKVYTALMDKLVENMNQFVDKMDEVKAGKAFVSGGRIQTDKFSEYVVEWRKTQGETQQQIMELQLKNPALFLKTQTAYLYLVRLGTMVSKRAWQVQTEVTEQYKERPVNPPSHQYFDRNFRYKVDLDKLQDQYDRVLDLVCPSEGAPPPPADGAAEAGEAKPSEE